jgi:hypothetical protein
MIYDSLIPSCYTSRQGIKRCLKHCHYRRPVLMLSQSMNKSTTFNPCGITSLLDPKMFPSPIGIERYWRNV